MDSAPSSTVHTDHHMVLPGDSVTFFFPCWCSTKKLQKKISKISHKKIQKKTKKILVFHTFRPLPTTHKNNFTRHLMTLTRITLFSVGSSLVYCVALTHGRV